ncbi:HelD family protein [Nocardioides ultimimeridianus]
MTQIADIAEVQDHFDRAWDRREAARAAAKAGGPAGTRHAQIALNSQNRNYLAKLAPADVAVAHGSIRLDDGEVVYVGRDTIWDEAKDILVVNWRTQIGELYERATVQDPRGVALKRTFHTDRNHVVAFDDVVFAELLGKVAELTELELSGVDDALLADLDTGRTGTMRDIVRTIQAAQSELIRHDSHALLVIQGGPGTGKSAVALHRASWLLFNEDGLTPDRVLVIGPTDTFTNYIKDVLPGLGDHSVPQLSLRRLGPQNSTRREEPIPTARLKGEDRMATLLGRALHLRIRFAGNDPELTITNGRTPITIPRADIEAQIDALRSAPTYNAGRLGMRSWLTSRVERALQEPGRLGLSQPVDMPAVDVALDRVWPPLTAQQFVRDLLGSQNRLQEAAGDDFTAGDIGRLFRRAAGTAAAETWADSDVALLDEAESLINGMPERYAHILVDEAQDLSPMQLRSVARRSLNGSMTIVGDVAQSTGPWARDSWDEVMSALSRPGVPVVLEELAYGYRVPSEIYAIAAQLLPYVAPGLQPLTVVRPAPKEPEFIIDNGDYDVIDETIDAITEHAKKGRFLGVIVTPEFKPRLAEELTSREISFADADKGSLGSAVNLISASEAKGLEFDAVIVVEPAAIAAMDRGLRLLYIALTRATKYLTVVYSQAFAHLGLEGAPPLAPPDIPVVTVAVPEPAPIRAAALPQPATPGVLSPALVIAAGQWAAQLRDEIAPHKLGAFIAEIARQLGLPE